MNYPKEVQAIFDLTLSLLENDEQFDDNLLVELRELCTSGNWENEITISGAVDTLLTTKEPTDG